MKCLAQRLTASLVIAATLLGARPATPGDGPEGMVWVAPGRAVLGSMAHYPEERPVIERQVDGFWIDRFEVTNARFAAFVEATGYVTEAERLQDETPAGSAVFRPPTEGGPGWHFVLGANWRHPEGPGSTIVGLDDHPVVQVTLADARAFSNWAGRDLPTEAQWEYAARADTESIAGVNIGTGVAAAPAPPVTPDGRPAANTWQGFFPLENQAVDGFPGRAPVGSFPADSRGLHDMIGNVWEWTRSPYRSHDSEAAAEDDVDDLAEAVIKGGSFLCAPVACRRYRASARHAQEAAMATNHLGFRTVLKAPGPGTTP